MPKGDALKPYYLHGFTFSNFTNECDRAWLAVIKNMEIYQGVAHENGNDENDEMKMMKMMLQAGDIAWHKVG